MGAESRRKVDFYVDTKGRVRDRNPWANTPYAELRKTELAAMAKLELDARAPDGVSDRVYTSPGRGKLRAFKETEVLPQGDKYVTSEKTYRAGCGAIQEDVFDRMADQSKRAGFGTVFTVHQVDAGRAYRDLHQRCASAGIKISSTFSMQAGGQGDVDFMDAYMADTQRLGWFYEAIGDGTAKDTKYKAAATEGKRYIGDVELRKIGRRLITVRTLVDSVCIKDQSLSDVLKAHGWRAAGKNRKTLRDALSVALWRMQGI